MLDRTQAPPIKDAVDFEFALPEIQSYDCPNGIPVYAYRGGSQPVIQVEWVFEAGLWHEDQTAVAQAVAALLKNGTLSRTEFEINEALEFYGASLRVSASNDYTTLTLYCLTKHLGAVLPVIFEILSIPSFPESELNIYKQNALTGLSVKLLQCDFVANRHIEARLFGRHHPYGRYAEAEDIEALNRPMLEDFFKKNFQPAYCKIFVAGLFSDEDLQKLMNVFGTDAWVARDLEVPTRNFKTSPATELDFRLINNESGVQAAVRMAKSIIDATHPDWIPLQVLNTVFGGYFGSRLMSSIREERGYTYGIYSYLASYRHEQMMMISSEVGRNVAQQTLDEIAVQMESLCTVAIPEAELLLVKNYILGGLVSDLDGPFSIMRMWKTMILRNEDADSFKDKISIIKSVQPDELQVLAQKYFRPDTFHTVVVV